MKRGQLFKRLMAITEDELILFLDFVDDINKALSKLDIAARTRHIIDAVQLEDMWQQLDEASQTFNIHIAMKLSPMTLCAGLESEVDMNCLEWRLVLPKYADIKDEVKPECIGDYLAMMKQIDIVDVNEYDIEKTCTYLDQVYDFTEHKQNRRAPFTRSRQ